MATEKVSSASSSSECSRYDVFLSFRGEDTRYDFTGHLYKALMNAGFWTFMDDDGIERGEYIKSELQKAIEESRISIIILSENFPSSKWCLDELVMILQRRRTCGLLVLPVFFDVDPSHFRKQTGSVAEVFLRHKERFKLEGNDKGEERIKEWKAALTEAANLAGMPFDSQADRLRETSRLRLCTVAALSSFSSHAQSENELPCSLLLLLLLRTKSRTHVAQSAFVAQCRQHSSAQSLLFFRSRSSITVSSSHLSIIAPPTSVGATSS